MPPDGQPGSMPVFLITGTASGAVRNFTSPLAASGATAALCSPAAKTVISWISAGSGPPDLAISTRLPATSLPCLRVLSSRRLQAFRLHDPRSVRRGEEREQGLGGVGLLGGHADGGRKYHVLLNLRRKRTGELHARNGKDLARLGH